MNTQNTPSVSTAPLRCGFRWFFTLALTVGCAVAQTISTDALGEKSAKNENRVETIVLSPFVVTGEKDTGYQATDTLVGTRLSTPLKDIAASISVVTSQFLEDTASTKALDFLVYTANTEVIGVGGNYGGYTGAPGQQLVFNDRQNVTPGNRLRGLAQADVTRNFFGSAIPMDSYNTQSVTINRGSNSILFGLGSPAGIIETTTRSPDFRNQNKIQLSISSYGSFRESVDLERVLFKDKLSVRVSAVNENQEYEQKPAYRDQRRYYGALEYRPFKSTRVRVSAEQGRVNQRLPRINPPVDALTTWWWYGKNVREDNTWGPGPDGKFNVNLEPEQNYQRLNNLDGGFGFFYWTPGVFFGNGNSTPTDSFPSFADDNNANIPVANQVLYRFLAPRATVDALRYAVRTPSGVANPLTAFWNFNQVLDRSIFDYRKQMIDGPNNGAFLDFHVLDASVEQLFLGGDAGVEVAFDKQSVNTEAFESFSGSPQLQIDPNRLTVYGQPNPNFGRPFIGGAGSASRNEREDETLRVTAFLKHDFTRNGKGWFARILGRHTATGFYTDMMQKNFRIDGIDAAFAPIYSTLFGTSNVLTASPGRRLARVVYLGPSLYDAASPIGAQIPNVNFEVVYPSTIKTWNLAPQTAPGANRVWTSYNIPVFSYPDWENLNTSVTANRMEVYSYGGVWQGNWLDNLLISTLGWRHDQVENFTGNNNSVRDPVTGTFAINRPRVKSFLAAENNLFSQGYALHMPSGWQKRLPAGLDPTLYYNKSENFQLTGFRQTLFGERISPQSGTTEEWGLGASAFNGKLSFRLTKYETVQENMSDTRITTIARLADIESRVMSSHTPAALAAAGYVLYSDSAASADFKRFAEVWKFTTLPADVNGRAPLSYVTPPGVTEVTSVVSTGYEFEAVYNPLPNWRIAMNVAQQKAVRGEGGQNMKQLMADRMAIWSKPSVQHLVAGPNYDVISYVTEQLQTPFARALQSTGQATPELREWHANVTTNYEFSRSSKFKGWSVGGSARWLDKITIGYPVINDPNLGLIEDLKHPFMAPAEITFDGSIGYQRKIFNNKINWKLQLNVRNLLNENLSVPVKANARAIDDVTNYDIAAIRIGAERAWTLTSTFAF